MKPSYNSNFENSLKEMCFNVEKDVEYSKWFEKDCKFCWNKNYIVQDKKRLFCLQ